MKRYRIAVTTGKNGLKRWKVVDNRTGKAVALPIVNETYHTHSHAMRAGLDFVEGMQRPDRTRAKLIGVTAAFGILFGIALCRLGGL